jgi:hypothetical protein
VKKLFWTWDIRTRWCNGFSGSAESFEGNYRALVDAAGRYGVEGIIVWGFLRDRHGGVDSARRVCDYAHDRGVMIIPGFGVDAYGGAFYEGDSPWSLDRYLQASPGSMAVDPDGRPLTHRWPPTDPNATHVCCPSCEGVMDYYRESIDWLMDTFDIRGVQIEQGDVGLCHCPRCIESRGKLVCGEMADFSAGARRMRPVIDHALARRPDLLIVVETYAGLLAEQINRVRDDIALYPQQVVLSWQAYNAPNQMLIDEQSRSPSSHGCMAVRTNNDCYGGEIDDIRNITTALRLAKQAGLDYTYTYGEYPDTWPTTRGVYGAWAAAAEQ